jgi:hypothetical protein
MSWQLENTKLRIYRRIFVKIPNELNEISRAQGKLTHEKTPELKDLMSVPLKYFTTLLFSFVSVSVGFDVKS